MPPRARSYDRAAPRGTGDVKAGGNYAADLLPLKIAKGEGYGTTLYLDAAEQKYVEEFSVSNFIGISRDGAYCTPKSGSILPSITNKMLMQIARDEGIPVEERAIAYSELADFREVGACGTATVMAPIASITDEQGARARAPRRAAGCRAAPPEAPPPAACAGTMSWEKTDTLTTLREALQAIQLGEREDPHGWMREVSV